MKTPDNKPLSNDDIALLDMPFDAHSSHLRGPAEGPAAIRDMMKCGSANSSTELGQELNHNPRIVDAGSVDCSVDSKAFDHLESAIDAICKQGAKPLTFGGDHSVTYPIIKSLAKYHGSFTILHFDAHPDLYDILDNNPLSHACPFARIMENKLANHLVQIGIRTLNQHQRDQAEKFNVEVHEMTHWRGAEQININEPVYITIDLDALDPAYAPGVSHFEPGGLSVRQILDVIHSLNVPVIGADIVEYNPQRDINGMTAMVATKLYKEVCGKMLER